MERNMKIIKDYVHYLIKQISSDKIIPRDEKHLAKIIKKEIEKNGNQCDLNHIDVSQIKDMNYLFFHSQFNGDISRWDVSKVKSMTSMFKSSQFDGDISNWNVSK
jgi:hypothetical protein